MNSKRVHLKSLKTKWGDPCPPEVQESDSTEILVKKTTHVRAYLTPGLDGRLGITKDERRYYDRMRRSAHSAPIP